MVLIVTESRATAKMLFDNWKDLEYFPQGQIIFGKVFRGKPELRNGKIILNLDEQDCEFGFEEMIIWKPIKH